jgi:FkbM family methyltransferase
LFHIKKRDKLFYIDIGAFHPWYLSNTALFYLSGSSGICIEPNPEQFKKFQRYRKSDINLNIGIANEAGILTYYQFNNPAFNTFSEEKATENNNNGFTRLEELKVEVKLLNEILEQYAGSREIDLLSIDVEGLDYSILDSLDFLKYAPNVICVETYKFL